LGQYLPTALGQLAFAWKLLNYGLDGKIDPKELDAEVTWVDGNMVFVVPPALGSDDDLIVALTNNLTIAFGAAAITLNRVREELGLTLPQPIESEEDQCIALTYQIRNAFAHDISEPKWQMNTRYRRCYEFGGQRFDLTELDGVAFEYNHIGGPGALFDIRKYFEEQFNLGGE
jgi:hypothetical protein